MEHSFWISTLFVALIGASVGQDMTSIMQDAKYKIEMDQLKNRKPGEGPTFPACNNQTTGKLMYKFTAKFPPYVQITRDFMDFRTIIFGHALDCNKKTQLYEQATIALVQERGLEDFRGGGDVLKNLGKAKKKVTPKGLCEEEYLICKNLIQDICVFTKKTTVYDRKDLHKMVKKIRYLPAVQGVCAQREQKRRAELAEQKKKGLLGNLMGNNDKKSGGLFGLGGGSSGGLFGGNSGGLLGAASLLGGRK